MRFCVDANPLPVSHHKDLETLDKGLNTISSRNDTDGPEMDFFCITRVPGSSSPNLSPLTSLSVDFQHSLAVKRRYFENNPNHHIILILKNLW
jgi:hypothetical protein